MLYCTRRRGETPGRDRGKQTSINIAHKHLATGTKKARHDDEIILLALSCLGVDDDVVDDALLPRVVLVHRGGPHAHRNVQALYLTVRCDAVRAHGVPCVQCVEYPSEAEG